AYNIYEDELRQNLIIAKLDEVIYRLDDIVSNQRELYSCLSQANRKIEELNNSINRLNSSVNTQTAIEQFNAECVQRELRYLNTMNSLCLYK
ncbi:MAG: hypothetical protein IJ725_01415, partial [Ruminococcus sp.]|nr:hypothetical protein [Ruminococcus sp.]